MNKENTTDAKGEPAIAPTALLAALRGTEGARQLAGMNLVGSNKDEKDGHIFACHEAIWWLARRLDEEIKWGHRECTHDDCRSSGTDCPANTGAERR